MKEGGGRVPLLGVKDAQIVSVFFQLLPGEAGTRKDGVYPE
ncbi:MAG: hypothetical protein ACTHKU_08810 [Verrucomicrobiota bacterium]